MPWRHLLWETYRAEKALWCQIPLRWLGVLVEMSSPPVAIKVACALKGRTDPYALKRQFSQDTCRPRLHSPSKTLNMQVTEWFVSEDSIGKKIQHRVQGVTGKDLIRALHEAPEDMAAWLDPASGDGKSIQEAMKDTRFKSLREGLVRIIAERSVSFRPCFEGENCENRCGSSAVRWQYRRREST